MCKCAYCKCSDLHCLIALTAGEAVTQGRRPEAYGVFFMGPGKGWRPHQIDSFLVA